MIANNNNNNNNNHIEKNVLLKRYCDYAIVGVASFVKNSDHFGNRNIKWDSLQPKINIDGMDDDDTTVSATGDVPIPAEIYNEDLDLANKITQEIVPLVERIIGRIMGPKA